MNGKILFLSTFCSAFLMASTTALSQTSVSINQQNSSRVSINDQNSSSVSITQEGGGSQNQISIGLSSANLGKPYILRISAPQGTRLNGQIIRNGKVLRQLRGGNQVSINLSPSLSKGKQTIRISGNYTPPQSSVGIQFSGPGTKVSQQTSGNGRLNQRLSINVR